MHYQIKTNTYYYGTKNKLTSDFLSGFFDTKTLLEIYDEFFHAKDGLTRFVYDYQDSTYSFKMCLVDFLTEEISEYVTKEELIESGYLSQDDIDIYDA